MSKSILYISYDGLTDPLGNSQILPYILELSHKGHEYYVLTYDKKDRFEQNKELVLKKIKDTTITWFSLRYHKKFSLFSTTYDILKGIYYLRKKLAKETIDIIHCRGYVGSLIGISLIRFFNAKYIFDMRGFWPEEKVDGGAWKQHGFIYKIAKFFEKKFLFKASAIVVLTHKAKKYIKDNKDRYITSAPIYVIPTSTDLNHFKFDYNTKIKRLYELKEKLDFRLIYIGSIGSWYKPNEMFIFFSELLKRYPHSSFQMYINNINLKNYLFELINQIEIKQNVEMKDKIFIDTSSYFLLPEKISQCDISISFIEPCFSKMSSFPTKFGETIACGLPTIINKGIGDTDTIVEEYNVGFVVEDFEIKEYQRVVQKLPSLFSNPEKLLQRCYNLSQDIMDLSKGVNIYNNIYNSL